MFAGDVAVVVVRSQLALAPDRLPEPPPPTPTGRKFALARRLAGVAAVTAVGVIGYLLGSGRSVSPPRLAPPSSQSNQPGPASKLPVAFPSQSAQSAIAPPAAASAIPPQSNEYRSRDTALPRAVPRQLSVSAARPQHAGEAAALTVSAPDAGANAAVVIGGLASGSAVSTGMQVGPNTWRLSVEDLGGAAITPPRGFVGAMALTIELHLADNTVADRKALQLVWSAKSVPTPATSQPRPPVDTDLMMKTGADLIASGDFSAARLMYRRLAEDGEPRAAFALAETYDPLVLGKLKISMGITPDVALAQSWYEKAKELGSDAAPERLRRLARLLP
jgi:TPR repeat protein